MPPAGYPAFLQYLQSGRVRKLEEGDTSLWPGPVAIHPQGHQFVVGLFNGNLQLWETETGKLLSTIKEAHRFPTHPRLANIRPKVAVAGLAWSYDGRRIASIGFDHRVKLWVPTTSERVKEWSDEDPDMPNRGPLELQQNTFDFLFAIDNKHLVTAGRDGIIRLWDLETGKISHRLHGHTDQSLPSPRKASMEGYWRPGSKRHGLVLVWDWEKRTPLKSVHLRPLMGENRFGNPPAWLTP